jgi:hypothetical protein
VSSDVTLPQLAAVAGVTVIALFIGMVLLDLKVNCRAMAG